MEAGWGSERLSTLPKVTELLRGQRLVLNSGSPALSRLSSTLSLWVLSLTRCELECLPSPTMWSQGHLPHQTLFCISSTSNSAWHTAAQQMFLVKECACPKVWVIAELLFLVKIFGVALTGPGGELLLSLVTEGGEGRRSSCPSRGGRAVPLTESLCPPRGTRCLFLTSQKQGWELWVIQKHKFMKIALPVEKHWLN